MNRAPDLAALHDALNCASAAVVYASRGDRAPASLSLLEAQTASEEAFGSGTPEAAALGVLLAAISQAARLEFSGRPWWANTMAGLDPDPEAPRRGLP